MNRSEEGFGVGSGESGGWHELELEQEQEQGVAVSTMWESEGLQTLGIVLIVCASLKLLHLLGLISFSEGKRERQASLREFVQRRCLQMSCQSDKYVSRCIE